MDIKQGALYTVLVLGGIGLLAVSCSDEEQIEAVMNAAKGVSEPEVKHVVVEHIDETDILSVTSEVHPNDWEYEGESGPSNWGDLKEEFGLCGVGKSQSPIDISIVTITELPDIEFNYNESPLKMDNNGHTLQINYAPGSSITVADKKYDLALIDFHSPSEHTVGGKAYDMVMHLIHKADDGQLSVIGVIFKAGAVNENIEELWAHIPASGNAIAVEGVSINAANLLPTDLRYFNYSGSLTTPPCSEGVNWMLLATPVTISPAQLKQFTDIFSLSVRSVQPLNGRMITLGN